MTRKDYELIAAALNRALLAIGDREEEEGVLRAAAEVAQALERDNPRFDAVRFRAAVLAGANLYPSSGGLDHDGRYAG